MKIKPFSYKLQAAYVIDNGRLFDAKVLEIRTEDILKKYAQVLNNVAAVSLEVGFPTLVSVRQSIINSFKNLVAPTFETGFSFPLADKLKNAASAAPVSAPAGGAPAQAAAPVEEKAEEIIKPFGNDDDEY